MVRSQQNLKFIGAYIVMGSWYM